MDQWIWWNSLAKILGASCWSPKIKHDHFGEPTCSSIFVGKASFFPHWHQALSASTRRNTAVLFARPAPDPALVALQAVVIWEWNAHRVSLPVVEHCPVPKDPSRDSRADRYPALAPQSRKPWHWPPPAACSPGKVHETQRGFSNGRSERVTKCCPGFVS